jgi:hypothetical protein
MEEGEREPGQEKARPHRWMSAQQKEEREG